MSIIVDHSKEYYRTSLKENALDYLDKLGLFFGKIKDDKSYWKWIIISLHGAIYHFMLLALENTDGSGVFKKDIRNSRGLIDYSKENNLILISFNEAFRRIKDSNKMGGYTSSKAYTSNRDVNKAMEDLNEWRNVFIHYKPKGWSIEIKIFEDILHQTLPVLKFIVNDCGRIILEECECEEINRMITLIENYNENS